MLEFTAWAVERSMRIREVISRGAKLTKWVREYSTRVLSFSERLCEEWARYSYMGLGRSLAEVGNEEDDFSGDGRVFFSGHGMAALTRGQTEFLRCLETQ